MSEPYTDKKGFSMTSFTREQIQQRALRPTAVTFLKSEAVAQAVAKRVQAHLERAGVGSATVSAGADPRRPGAWRVQVLNSYLVSSPRVMGDRGRANAETNSHASRAIGEALKASYGPNDLLTHWVSPRR
jgi:hypothetical protein